MNENLVGFLMGGLDAEAHEEVERLLSRDSEAREQLERLKFALEPLALDKAADEPPPGLWVRTLGHIARHQCREIATASGSSLFRNLPAAPRSPRWEDGGNRPTWRWADVAAVAAVMFIGVSLGLVGLTRVWRDEVQLACQNNLRELHHALIAYSERHRGEFPKVATNPPDNVAGIFVPILQSEGVLNGPVNLTCPGRAQTPGPLPTLDDLRQMPPDKFALFAQQLGGSYAYSLGYGDPENLSGLKSDDHGLPILADRPLLKEGRLVADANSPNHGGRGQNVLFVDGHVQFFVVRNVGVDRDDIFTNMAGRVGAGRHRLDSVLGASAANPFPAE